MVIKNPFRGKGEEERDHRDNIKKASREGSGPPSRASSRDNRKRSDVASQFPKAPNMGYLRRTLEHFACMPGLAEDVGLLLKGAKKNLEELRTADGKLFGRGMVGTYVNECTKHLVKSQNLCRKLDTYIKKEETKLKEEGLVQIEGDTTAYEKAFEEAHRCSPETWEVRRIIGKNRDDLGLIIARYDELLKSKNCVDGDYNRQVVEELLASSSKLRAKHKEALSILAIDNTQEHKESRSDTRVPRPDNTGNYTGRARKPLPGRS